MKLVRVKTSVVHNKKSETFFYGLKIKKTLITKIQLTSVKNFNSIFRDWCISRQLWWGHRIPVWKVTSPNQVSFLLNFSFNSNLVDHLSDLDYFINQRRKTLANWNNKTHPGWSDFIRQTV